MKVEWGGMGEGVGDGKFVKVVNFSHKVNEDDNVIVVI